MSANNIYNITYNFPVVYYNVALQKSVVTGENNCPVVQPDVQALAPNNNDKSFELQLLTKYSKNLDIQIKNTIEKIIGLSTGILLSLGIIAVLLFSAFEAFPISIILALIGVRILHSAICGALIEEDPVLDTMTKEEQKKVEDLSKESYEDKVLAFQQKKSHYNTLNKIKKGLDFASNGVLQKVQSVVSFKSVPLLVTSL